MQIIITGRGVNLTDAIEDYVNKKINSLERFFPHIIRADVAVGRETKRHLKGPLFIAECKLAVPGKDVFASKKEGTLYKAVDKVRDYLESELKKHKTKLRGSGKQRRRGGRSAKEYQLSD